MLETCPAARLRFRRKAGPCPALEWSSADSHYQCGLLTRPGHYLGWLPAAGEKLASRLFARWIAAGQGCDCSAEANEVPPSGKQGVADGADGNAQTGTERGRLPDRRDPTAGRNEHGNAGDVEG
jgi:hypothetical protein